MDRQELNKKLAEWAGFVYKFGGEWFYEKYKSTNAWYEAPNGRRFKDLPKFTQSLDACFKWLVPKLFRWSLTNVGFDARVIRAMAEAEGRDKLIYQVTAEAETPALALCLAIERLIET